MAADQPQWGTAWGRNLVSEEKNLPESWDLETGRNVKWVAVLGTQSFATPIVADGRVYIGTNNEEPRDPKHVGDRGVYLCLDEKDGHLLWQLVAPKRNEDQFYDWPKTGMSSAITIEGDRGYLLTNRAEVVCLDVHGLANGNDGPFKDEAAHLTPYARASAFTGGATAPGAPKEPATPEALSPTDADIVWLVDLPSEAGIWPHDGAHSSILIDGDFLYLNTGTGVDNSHKVIRGADAPSLIVMDKKSGRIVAREDEHIAPNIFHATWSSPAMVEIGGRKLIVFAAGDGIIRGFEAVKTAPPEGTVATLKKAWEFDFDPAAPKTDIHRFLNNRREGPSNIYGMPVVVGDRIYVAGGGDVFWGKSEAWLKCINANENGGTVSEVWSYPLDKHTLSTAAVYDGLVFVADVGRKIHCLDAVTGQLYWTQVTNGDFWASPMVADGKVYIGTRKGDFWVLAASREKKVLGTMEFKSPISGTATAANGVLYVATMQRIYALQGR